MLVKMNLRILKGSLSEQIPTYVAEKPKAKQKIVSKKKK